MAAPDRTRIVLIACLLAAALAGALGIGALMVLGLMVETHFIPDTEAAPGEDLPRRVVEMLVENGIVEPGETILYYYSDGFLSHLDDGNLFTTERVISYERVDGELSTASAAYEEIEDIGMNPFKGF